MSNRYTFSATFLNQQRAILFLYGLLLAIMMPLFTILQYPAVFMAGALPWQAKWFILFFLGVIGSAVTYLRTQTWSRKDIVLAEDKLITDWWTGIFIWQEPAHLIEIPYQELKKVELTRNRAGQLLHLLIQGPHHTFQFIGMERFEELGQRLVAVAPAGVVHEKQVWINWYSPWQLLWMPTVMMGVFLAIFYPSFLFLPAAMLILGPLSFPIIQPLRQFMALKTGWADILFGFLGTAMMFSIMSNDLREHYQATSCFWLKKPECLTYYLVGSQGLAFSTDGQTVYLNSPQTYPGVWVQPLEGGLRHFEATFIPVPKSAIFANYLSLDHQIILPTHAEHHFLSFHTNQKKLFRWDAQTGEILQQMDFSPNEWDKADIQVISPTGRYLFWGQRHKPETQHTIPKTSSLALLENQRTLTLPAYYLEAAAFSADETALYLLTPTELLTWDIASASVTHSLPRPVELQGKTSQCLVHLGDEQFLLTTDDIFWEWHLNQPPQLRLTAQQGYHPSSMPDDWFSSEYGHQCLFFAGPDWVFVYHNIYSFARGELYHLQSGEQLWAAADSKIHHWAVSPDGRYLAGSDSDYTYLFDFELLRQQK